MLTFILFFKNASPSNTPYSVLFTTARSAAQLVFAGEKEELGLFAV